MSATLAPSRIAPSAGADPRPLLAILAPEMTPYRLHFHRRIVREMPGWRLRSLITWGSHRTPWTPDPGAEAEVGTVRFGEGEKARRTGRLGTLLVEREKARAVRRWLEEHRPAALVCAGYTEPTALAAIRWAHRRRVPLLLHTDSNIAIDTARGLKRLVKRAHLRWVLRRTAAVLPFGTRGRDYFLRYGADPARIFFSPCEPDYGLLADCPPERTAEVSRRFGLDPARRRILVCGRLAPVKRPDLALKAFGAIARERPEWDLVFAGDGPLRAALEARVAADLKGRVIFAGFIGDQATLSAVFRACHVLLHPADYEPWALVLNEAAAAGLAIVASETVGAAAELVREGVNGRACPPGDAASLGEALREATDEGRLGSLREGSLRVIAEWRREADPVEGLRRALRAAGFREP